jgi:hypothetical protein
MAAELQLEVSRDVALVLFELLARFQETGTLSVQHPAEFLALSQVAGQLEKTLAEPFAPEYRELLERARSKLAEGFQGVAPGMPGGGV